MDFLNPLHRFPWLPSCRGLTCPLVPPASITPSTPVTTLTVASSGRPVTRSCPAYDPFMTSAAPFSPLRAPILRQTSKSQPRIGEF